MPIRAVVFDLFDTLVDLCSENIPLTEHKGRRIPSTFLSLHELVAEHGPVELDDFVSVSGELEKQFLKTHYSEHVELSSTERFSALATRLGVYSPALVEEMVEVHMRGLSQHVRILEHHRGVLEALKQKVRLGLCSNFSHSPTAERVLVEARLSDLMDEVVISDRVGIRKPRAEIFQAILEALQVEAHETLHVGDSLKADVGGASPLGIRTVWITRRIAEPQVALSEFSGPEPDFQIADLSELSGILQEVGSS